MKILKALKEALLTNRVKAGNMKIMLRLFAVLCVPVLFSCASGAAVIPEDATADKLIQWGQEASDNSKYGQALRYYQAVLEKFPASEYAYDAQYEIAFIHYKEKKYAIAKDELNNLLALYEGPDAELYPGQYKILAKIVLEKIEKKEIIKR
jgi:outer membrane protein assembly factor BamD (BamD/ComL family)